MLISVKPHVAALSNDNLETYCSNCFGPGSGPLRRCTGCKAILYCDSVSLSSSYNKLVFVQVTFFRNVKMQIGLFISKNVSRFKGGVRPRQKHLELSHFQAMLSVV